VPYAVDRTAWGKPARLHTLLRAHHLGLASRIGDHVDVTSQADSRRLIGFALANDIRGFEVDDVEMQIRTERLLQGFEIGASDCRFLPYWGDERAAEAGEPTTHVSAYVRPDRALLVVVNCASRQGVSVRPDPAVLGGKAARLRDAERDRPVERAGGGWLRLDIPPYGYRLIWVGPFPGM
jgi:hypothetical protein